MKPHIMLNTKLRTAAENEFEKDFFKLMERPWEILGTVKTQS